MKNPHGNSILVSDQTGHRQFKELLKFKLGIYPNNIVHEHRKLPQEM